MAFNFEKFCKDGGIAGALKGSILRGKKSEADKMEAKRKIATELARHLAATGQIAIKARFCGVKPGGKADKFTSNLTLTDAKVNELCELIGLGS